MKQNVSIKNLEILTRIVCTFAFTLFTLFYLYYFQADLLTVMQHVLSKGQTHYNHLVGAILITLVLLLIQVGVFNMCRKAHVAWSLTFIPSTLCLVFLTDIRQSTQGGLLEFGGWTYGLPIALLLFGISVWWAKISGLSERIKFAMGGNVRSLWMNLLMILILILIACFCGNTDSYYHARIHMEQAIMNNDYDEALNTSQRLVNNKPDRNITMLTAYALSKKGELAESLFEYNPSGGAMALMPDGRTVKFELLPDSSFYSFLGGWYLQRMSTMKYLDYTIRRHRMTRRAVDYLLCGYLMDKELDKFADKVVKYYTVNDSTPLPKHYKEALVLYNHMRSNPFVIYKDNVMDADFQDYQKLEKTIHDSSQRQTALRDSYGNTYWYYYQYIGIK